MIQFLRGSLLLLLFICSLSFAYTQPNPAIAFRDLSGSHTPSLTAVKVRSDLQRRGENFQPKNRCDHHYADHASVLSGSSSRFAKTSMKYKWPALTLEDIEDDLKDVKCSQSTITLQFSHQSTFDYAREAWGALPNFLIITSHLGCNGDGERAPHLVSGSTFQEHSLQVLLSVQQIAFSEAYDTMTVRFGASRGEYQPDEFRFHDDLRRRQIPSTVSYPSAPTGTSTTDTSTKNIAYKAEPDQEIFSYSHSTTDLIKDTITISCKECSIDGIIELTEGEFTVGDSDTLPFKAKDFIDHGYFKTVANGMKAHIELDTKLELSSTQTFDMALATISLPGFSVPGIAAIGPIFQPHIKATLETKGTLGFGYGFSLKVPDNSSVVLNIGNITESTSDGFGEAEITAIPLTASAPEITITLGLGLIAEVLLGIDILNGQGSMTAGFFFDLPALSVAISQISGMNAQCENIADSSAVDEFLSHIFPNLTHIVPKIEIGMGVQAGVELNVANVGIHETIGTQTTLAGTEFPLPTTCLSWDGEKSAFATPAITTAAAAEATGAGAGAEAGVTGSAIPENKKINVGGRGRDNPLSDGKPIYWCGGMLLSLLFVAMSL